MPFYPEGTDNKTLNAVKDHTKLASESSLRIEKAIEKLNRSSETLEYLTFVLIALTVVLIFNNMLLTINAIRNNEEFWIVEGASLIVAALLVGYIVGKVKRRTDKNKEDSNGK